jgi:hypothetical protein
MNALNFKPSGYYKSRGKVFENVLSFLIPSFIGGKSHRGGAIDGLVFSSKKVINIKKFKKKTKSVLFSIKLPDFTLPQVDWSWVAAISKLIFKYIIIMVSVFAIVIATIYIFSDRLIQLLVNKYELFQTKTAIELIKREMVPIEAKVENLQDRIQLLEIGKETFLYFKHAPRKYEVLGKKGKYIIR